MASEAGVPRLRGGQCGRLDLVELASAAGTRHPWEEARCRFLLGVLERSGVADRPLSVLDVGAGDGWFARQLAARFPALARIACWDSGYDADLLARTAFASTGRVAFSRERPAGAFDLLLLLDVLEHVEEDGAFLSGLAAGSLAPGGWALVTVPAWPSLYGAHDRRLRHHRRYAPRAARALLRGAGLEVRAEGGLFTSLLAVRAAQLLRERVVASRRPPPDLGAWRAGRGATAVVRGALACDAGLSSLGSRLGVTVPGLSYWALCRRPSR
jgi:SAM-dependent methyltransferase